MPATGLQMGNKIGERSSVVAERATLGAVLISSSMLPRVKPFLAKERFASGGLGYVYAAILRLSERHEPIDRVSVSEELYRAGELESAGGRLEIAAIVEETAFADHGEHYAKVVADLYYEREVVKASRALATDQSSDNLEKVRSLVLAREQLGLPHAFDYMTDLPGILDDILKKRTGRRHEVGFPSLDRAFVGLAPGEVVTWGAATNTGKSLVLLNIASHCAMRREPVLYVGTEMSAQETVSRHLSITTGIEPYKIRSAKVSTDEIVRLNDALADRLSQFPMRILDLPEPSLTDVESALTASRAQVVFLDYLERFKLPPGDNFRLRVNDFMRRVKNMARKYDCVIHLASQLSRAVYGQEEKRPTLAHLSESSAIEKESDRVILMWTPKAKNQEGVMNPNRVIEVELAKNRHGRRGLTCDLTLDEKNLQIREVGAETQEEVRFHDNN